MNRNYCGGADLLQDGVDFIRVEPNVEDIVLLDYDLSAASTMKTCRLKPIENPFGPKVLPMSPL